MQTITICPIVVRIPLSLDFILSEFKILIVLTNFLDFLVKLFVLRH